MKTIANTAIQNSAWAFMTSTGEKIVNTIKKKLTNKMIKINRQQYGS